MSTIQSGVDTTVATVDPTSKALHTTLYDTSGNVVTPSDWATYTPGTSPMAVMGGVDYKSTHAGRFRMDGSQSVSNDSLLFFDPLEGAALNTNLWTSTLTSWTVASVTNGVLLMNPASTLTATTGQLLSSIIRIPRYPRVPLVSVTRAKPGAHYAGSVHEIGFGLPSSATATTAADGAFWRKDTAGQWLPVLSINGIEILGTAISDTTFTSTITAGEYAEFKVILHDDRAEFAIESMGGVLVSGAHQYINWNTSGSGNTNFTTAHLYSMLRSYNSSAVATAVQLAVAGHAVYLLDLTTGRPWPMTLSAAGYHMQSSPTVFTQTTNYTNNAAPTTRTVTNTTALEATLGGHVSWNNAGTAFGVDDTKDWVLFGFAATAPYAFYCTGIRVDTINLGAANGASIYAIEYAIAANSNAVSLATASPNGPRFMPIGFQTIAASAAVGTQFNNPIQMTFGTPIVIQPGKFIHLVGRVLSGAATASQVIRTVCYLDGFWQ